MPDCTDTVTYSKLSIVIWHDAIAIALVELLSPLALFLLPPLALCAALPPPLTLLLCCRFYFGDFPLCFGLLCWDTH